MIREHELHFGTPDTGAPSRFSMAWADLIQGCRNNAIWGILGWQDIRQRYRRSVLGPFWLTLSTAIMVGALAFVYSSLFKQTMASYLPFIGVGLIVWALISTIFGEACTVFIGAEGMIKQLRLPLTVHVCRMVWRNIIIFGHNAVILLVIYVMFGTGWHPDLLTIPLAVLLYAFDGLAIGIILGVFCTRFRDIVQIVANIIQLVFFATPIMWRPEVLADRAWIADYNPIYHLIELIRAPLLGQPLPVNSWLIAMGVTVLALAIALGTLARFRHRVAYWL